MVSGTTRTKFCRYCTSQKNIDPYMVVAIHQSLKPLWTGQSFTTLVDWAITTCGLFSTLYLIWEKLSTQKIHQMAINSKFSVLFLHTKFHYQDNLVLCILKMKMWKFFLQFSSSEIRVLYLQHQLQFLYFFFMMEAPIQKAAIGEITNDVLLWCYDLNVSVCMRKI